MDGQQTDHLLFGVQLCQQGLQSRAVGIRQLGQGVHIVIVGRFAFIGRDVQMGDDILQLTRVLALFAFFLSSHLGQFRTCQVVLLLTIGKAGVEHVYAMAAVADDHDSGDDKKEDD